MYSEKETDDISSRNEQLPLYVSSSLGHQGTPDWCNLRLFVLIWSLYENLKAQLTFYSGYSGFAGSVLTWIHKYLLKI